MSDREIPVIQFIVILFAAFYVVVNIPTDMVSSPPVAAAAATVLTEVSMGFHWALEVLESAAQAGRRREWVRYSAAVRVPRGREGARIVGAGC